MPVIISAVLAVVGYLIVTFLINPYRECRKTIGEIANALRYYANISALAKRELQDEAHNAFRQNATRLQTSVDQFPFYKWLSRWTNLPPNESIKEAYGALIGLSNAVYENNYEHIARYRQKIFENLRLSGID